MAEHTPLHLLLIDDCPEDAELLSEALMQVAPAADVVPAGSAEEGLALARTGSFDLLLLDLPAPDLMWVLNSVHEVARYRLMPVVVTGRFLEPGTRATVEALASVVLQKGQSFHQLRELASGLVRFWRHQVVQGQAVEARTCR